MSGYDMTKIKHELCDCVVRQLCEKPNERLLAVSYSAAFREWMLLLQTRLTENYQIKQLQDLIEQIDKVSDEAVRSIWTSSVKKIISCGLGLMPCIGGIFSVTQTIMDIAATTYEYHLRNSEIRILQDQFGLRSHKRKNFRKIKYILFVPDYNGLSDNQQRYVRFVAHLIEEKYLSSTALIVGIINGGHCMIPVQWTKELLLTKEMTAEWFGHGLRRDGENLIELLNIIGISYMSELKAILANDFSGNPSIEEMIGVILDKTIKDESVSRKEFHRFLRLCSLLFEPFMQEDIEKTYPVKELTADELVEYALKSRVLQKNGNSPLFSFVEYFIRDFYRCHTYYTLSTQNYDALFSFLKEKYPRQYTDIALLSEHVGKPYQEITDYGIIAWYHEHDTISQRKKSELRHILCQSEYGENYIKLFELYIEFDKRFDKEKCLAVCEKALRMVEQSVHAAEAQCCYLNIIATIAFETGPGREFFNRVFIQYFDAFQKLKIFSESCERYVEYIADALLLSAGMELSPDYKDSLERLASRIDLTAEMSHIKRLRLLRLGNVIFPAEHGHDHIQRAYAESADYPYEHVLAAINYSASLLSRSEFTEAKIILDKTASLPISYHINSNTTFSFRNNQIIAQALHRPKSKKKAVKRFGKLYQNLRNVPFSDSVIVQNNYAAMLVFSSNKCGFAQAEKILLEIIETQGEYHRFYALHNLLIIYCLTARKEIFLQKKALLKVPYLLRTYADLFDAKFELLHKNFDDCTSLDQIEKHLMPLSERFPEFNSSINLLPVLFGVIERWFE